MAPLCHVCSVLSLLFFVEIWGHLSRQTDSKKFLHRQYSSRTTNGTKQTFLRSLKYIGVKYNLLEGNPEGTMSAGGIDPGLDATRRILKLTYKDGYKVPDHVFYEPRGRCEKENTTNIYAGTRRYQETLYEDVKIKGKPSILSEFAFSLSANFKEMFNRSNNGTVVFIDQRTICNKGSATYSPGNTGKNGWILDDEYASDVRKLSAEANTLDQYFLFLEKWGTHFVTGVTFGTKQNIRYRIHMKQFISKALRDVPASVYVSRDKDVPNNKVVRVDVNKIKETRNTVGREIGERYFAYTVGGEDLSEPIALKLTNIEETLNDEFLQHWKLEEGERILTDVKKNLQNALRKYARMKESRKATDFAIELPLSWPSGTYALPAASFEENITSSCPEATGFQWQKGSVRDNTRKYQVIPDLSLLPLVGVQETNEGITFQFCSKTQENDDQFFSMPWPKGKYCIASKNKVTTSGKCPEGFKTSFVKWYDRSLDPSRFGKVTYTSGEVPDGKFEARDYVVIFFCCRADGSASDRIQLPDGNAFVLMRVGDKCQEVCGTSVSEIDIETKPRRPSLKAVGGSVIEGKVRPSGYTKGTDVKLWYCIYRRIEDAE